jgi:hypothetical protein
MIQITSSSLKIKTQTHWTIIEERLSFPLKKKEKKLAIGFITQVSIGFLSTIIIWWMGTLIAFNAPNPLYSSYMILSQVYKLITFSELYGNKSLAN